MKKMIIGQIRLAGREIQAIRNNIQNHALSQTGITIMLSIIELLELKGLDCSASKSIKLVRHKDRRVDVDALLRGGNIGKYGNPILPHYRVVTRWEKATSSTN